MPIKHLGETTLSVEIWVAGTSIDEALARRDQVIRHMDRPPMRLIAAGYGRFFYDLWRINAGIDPLCNRGDVIADAEFHLTAPPTSNDDMAALTRSITADLEQALGFAVAVHIDNLEADDAPLGEVEEEFNIDPDAPVLIRISEREHSHVLAALRRVASKGGLEGTPEGEIAENGQNWGVMSCEEIDALGDKFNSSAIVDANSISR